MSVDVAKDAVVFSAEGEMGSGNVKLKQNPSVDKVNTFFVKILNVKLEVMYN